MMSKLKYILIIVLLSAASSSNAQNMKNNGAYIRVYDGMFVRINLIDFINQNNGNVNLDSDAYFTATNDVVNRSQNFLVNDSSRVVVRDNFDNQDILKVADSAEVYVWDVLKNSGFITNLNLIQIGDGGVPPSPPPPSSATEPEETNPTPE